MTQLAVPHLCQAGSVVAWLPGATGPAAAAMLEAGGVIRGRGAQACSEFLEQPAAHCLWALSPPQVPVLGSHRCSPVSLCSSLPASQPAVALGESGGESGGTCVLRKGSLEWRKERFSTPPDSENGSLPGKQRLEHVLVPEREPGKQRGWGGPPPELGGTCEESGRRGFKSCSETVHSLWKHPSCLAWPSRSWVGPAPPFSSISCPCPHPPNTPATHGNFQQLLLESQPS